MKTRKPTGIIDTLWFGFVAVSRRLWLLLFPVGLDLYLWRGPHLSIQPLFERLAAQLTAVPASELGADMAGQVQLLRETVLALGQRFNLFSLVVTQSVGVPSLLADPLVPSRSEVPTLTVSSPIEVLAIGLLLALGGLIIATLWLGLVALAVRGARGSPGEGQWAPRLWLRRGLVNSGRLILIGLIFFAASLTLLPMLLALGLVTLVSPSVGLAVSSILSIALVWLALWLTVHFYFVPEAVVLNSAGPLRALSESFHIVGRNFWSALLFIGLVFVISRGLGFIWLDLASSTPGLFLAILGNAYVGTSLLAATFIFFTDRYQLWQRQRAEESAR
ncbi:MAG: hypothetical protein M5U01_20940 [Ardenticatenaceae bacterium]|nr:hypothetical protein [Ardenticatenaceae bacterium]